MKDRMEVWEAKGLPAGKYRLVDAHIGMDGAVVSNLRRLDGACVSTVTVPVGSVPVFFRAVDARAWAGEYARLVGEYGREFIDGNTLFKIRDSSLVDELCSASFGTIDPPSLGHMRLVASNCVMDVVFYAGEELSAKARFIGCNRGSSLHSELVFEGIGEGCLGGAAAAAADSELRESASGGGRLEVWPPGCGRTDGLLTESYDRLDVDYGRDGLLRVYLAKLCGGFALRLVVEGEAVLFRSIEELLWIGRRSSYGEHETEVLGKGVVFRVCDSSLVEELAVESGGAFSADDLVHLLFVGANDTVEVVFRGSARLEPAFVDGRTKPCG